jgi:type I restriction enzyme, S subunit
MQVPSRISAVELTDKRLDAEYYEKSYRINARLISQFGRTTNLENIRSAKAPIRRGIDMPKFVELSDAPVIVTISAFEEPNVNFSKLQKIDIQQHSRFKGSHLKPGDLLIAMGGYAGKSAICPSDTPLANIGRHTARVVIDPQKANKYYIWSFISSSIGKLQFGREITGSVQAGINIEDLREILISMPALEVQKYIGDKVRQAERLRDRSRHLEKEINTFFIVKGWDGDLPGNSKSFKALASAINPGRLDAAFYDPAYLRLEDCLKASKSIAISTLAKQVKKGWNKDMDEFLYFEIGSIDLGSGTIKPSRQRVVDAPSRAQLSIKAWDILVSTVRPNRKNVALVLESDENLELVASNGFSVLRFPSKEEAVFYHSWLRLDAATLQMMRWNAGGSYPAIDDSIAISTLVPDFPDEVVKNQGQKWLIKFIGKDFSERLTMAAKLLVEALIEGKISEGDLKAAQKGLEKSEITLDREILARLTRKGIDFPNEPPLFPDLDALYAALASLDATETTETANPDQNRVSNVYHLHSTPLALASEAHETAYQVTAEVPE